MKKEYGKEILLALSLANLLFFPSWRRLLYSSQYTYTTKYAFSSSDYLSLLLLVIILAAMFFGAFVAERKFLKSNYLSKGFFLVFTAGALLQVTIFILKTQFWIIVWMGRSVALIIAMAIALAGLAIAIKNFNYIISIARTVVLILSPFIFITFSQSVWGIINSNSATQNASNYKSEINKDASKEKIKTRVVWVIFDEFDYKVAFAKRPKNVKMPEFDKLEKESIKATNAKAPSTSTLSSIPAMIVGELVKGTKPVDANNLTLNLFDEGKTLEFKKTSNIFSKVKSLGGNTAAVGWYHPYCRVIGKDLSHCSSEPFDYLNDVDNQTFFQSMSSHFYAIKNAMPNRIKSYLGKESNYIKRHKNLMAETMSIVKNKDVDLSFIHLTVPHYPYLYSKKTDAFTGGSSYSDNLVLTDKVLGDIRQQMEESNLWDDSVVIISSDHPWRVKGLKSTMSKEDLEISEGVQDERIPFFIKLKNQESSAEFEKSFNTVVTQELIYTLMQGEISTVEEVKDWLDSRATEK